MFKNVSLKVKVLGICVTLALFSAIVGSTGYVALNKVDESYKHIAEVNLPNAQALGELKALFRRGRVVLATFGIQGLSAEDSKKNQTTLDETYIAYDKVAKKYESVKFVEGEQQLWEAVTGVWVKFRTMADKISKLAQVGTPEAKEQLIKIYFAESIDLFKEYTIAIDALLDFQQKQADASVAMASDTSHDSQTLIIVFTIIGFIVALTIGYFFSTSLSNKLNQISESLAAGAQQVAAASRQVSDAGSELSASTTEQAAALQETVSSIDEVSAMVNLPQKSRHRVKHGITRA